VRKLTRAATLALFVLATTSGVAGLEVMAASPAMAQPNGPGDGSAPGPGQPTDPTGAVTGLVGSLTGGSGALAH
jgi:hypothetical protein